jgi:hypothetical protein
MRFPSKALIALLFGPGLAGSVFAQTVPIPNASFEQEGLARWTLTGDVAVDRAEKVDGEQALRLRRDARHLPPTRAVSDDFPIQAGVWEFSGAVRPKLWSPDVSFNVAIAVVSLDREGREIKRRRLVAIDGESNWRRFKERVEIPTGTAEGRLEVEFHKTHGDFWLDGLEGKFVGEAVPMEGGDRKVIFRTNRVGNLFFPGDPVRLEMTVETPVELAADSLNVSWQLTDFYGAPQSDPLRAQLEKTGTTPSGWKVYKALLDARGARLRVGPYYEVRTAIDLGASSLASDTASLAILPESGTKNLDPMKSPFGAHTWNATVYEYFPLAARLGIRRCLVFWSFPEQAPYAPKFDHGRDHLSRLGWPRRFGLAPYGVLYPLMHIEHRDGPEYSDEALREGIRQSIEKYRDDGLWGFQIGNEPPSFNPEMVKRDVEAYQVAFEAIKKADPDFFVIGSAIGPNEIFFQAGFQPWQDAYNIHAYSDLGELRHEMKKYRELFRKYGGEKPIWSTEIGSKSQGLPRDVIARDIIRKAVSFFADGGEFFSWFAVGGMPDPDGERTGGYSDSMDLFAAKYNMHLPRLDAVAYFHLIDGLGAKRFVEERQYPEGTQGFLFRDEQDNALGVFWNGSETRDVFLPLPGVHEVTLTSMTGEVRRMDAGGEGVTLRIGEDPVFVAFRGGKSGLPEDLAAAKEVVIQSLPGELTEGETAEIALHIAKGKTVELEGPVGWPIQDVKPAGAGDGGLVGRFRVTVPETTTARLATFMISDETVTAPGNVAMRFSVPVTSRIEVDLQPLAGEKEGDTGVELVVKNRSDSEQTVKWQVEILDELPMAGGTYRLPDARPSQAFFPGVAADQFTLRPLGSERVKLPLSDTDRQTIYRLRATVTEGSGNTVRRERRVGGFARVPQATGPVKVDGRLDEPFWQDVPGYRLDEARQFCLVEPDAEPWEGKEDLSGVVKYAWDAENLYVAVEVKDDVFANPGADNLLWKQDGLQFLIDPFRQETRSLGRYDYAMGLGKKGLQAWCHMSADPSAPAGAAPEIRLAVQRVGSASGSRAYEVAFPWTRLAPFRPAVGACLGLTVVLNEDDGAGRKSTMGWFGGVHLKEALFVGDLILAPPSSSAHPNP